MNISKKLFSIRKMRFLYEVECRTYCWFHFDQLNLLVAKITELVHLRDTSTEHKLGNGQ